MAFPTDSTYVNYLGGGYHVVAEPAPALSLTWSTAFNSFAANVDPTSAASLSGIFAVEITTPRDVKCIVPAAVHMVNLQAGTLLVSPLCGIPTSSTLTLSSSDTVFRLVPNS